MSEVILSTDRLNNKLSAALRESEERYRRLAELSPEAIFVVCQDRIVFANAAMVRLCRAPDLSLVLGRSPLESLSLDSPERFQNWLGRRHEKEPTPLQYALTWNGLEETRLDVEMIAAACKWNGDEAVQVVMRERTPRHRAEEALRISEAERGRLEQQLIQAQKMDEIGQLAGGVAHDFNNLLSVILGYAELVESEMDEGNAMRPNVQNIQHAATRAANLTRQLLAFARRQVTESRTIDANALMSGMKTIIVPLLGERIALTMALEARAPRIKVDANQIEQVIVNLVINARDAMPDGGALLLQTENATLTENSLRQGIAVKPGPYLLMTVADTGAGMTKEIQARLFEPFFTTKEIGKGTGLGLVTCYGIVKQNQGYIWIESESGRGTTVKVYLPTVQDEVAITPQRPESSSIGQGSETVLVVEDEDLVRELTVSALRRNGYTVLEAGNGVEALRIAEDYAKPIHLVLSDMIMPQMGGQELAARLKQMRPEIRVLFASGYSPESYAPEGTTPLQTPLLQKPFTSQVLLARVREVLTANTGH